MIQVNNLAKEFSDRILFSDVTFSINKGERVGLVGRNGMGKSTLFKIIHGEISSDEGEVKKPKNYSLASLDQFLKFTKKTVLEECCFKTKLGHQVEEYEAEKILMGLGFSNQNIQNAPESFSGGYQIRINLAKCLLEQPDLLLLDEPTNYLDLVSQKWFSHYLKNFRGEIVLITHDRKFMDEVCTHVMGIHRQKVKKVQGKFSDYAFQISEEERVFEQERNNSEKKRKQIEAFITKFRAKAGQGSLASSRAKMLDKMQAYDQLEDIQNLEFNFNEIEFSAKTFIEAKDLGFGYSEKLLFNHLSFYLNTNERIAIIGKNGSGKSTLLKILNDELKVSHGDLRWHPKVEKGYFGQTNIEALNPRLTIEEEITSANTDLSYQKVKAICGAMMFAGDDSEKLIRVLSGGEKSRVLLGKILAKKCNLLLLDEPTHHLDQETVSVFIDKVNKFKGGVIFVTHSEEFISKVATKIIYFKNDSAHIFDGSYEEFLEKVGWEDEVVEKTLTQKQSNETNAKKLKKMKSDITRDMNRETKPFKKKLEDVELSITEFEANIKSLEEEMADFSNTNKLDFSASSKKLHELKENLDLLLNEYENIFNEIEQIEEKYKKQMNAL